MLRQIALVAVTSAVWICGAAVSAQTYRAGAHATIIGEIGAITARREDTLIDLARAHDLGFEELVAANPDVDPWLPEDGARVVLPTRWIVPNVPRVGIVVNVAAMRLFYFPPATSADDAAVITYPIAIGRTDWRTPLGATTIIAKVRGPVWDVPPTIRDEHARDGDPLPAVVPPGPGNPLGEYALRLGLDGYLIHGTNRRFGIGMPLTHGCMRLYGEDIQALFGLVSVGTPVRIINARILAAWDHGVLYVEAHPPDSERADDRTEVVDAIVHAPGVGRALTAHEWDVALELAAHPQGIPQPVTTADASDPVVPATGDE